MLHTDAASQTSARVMLPFCPKNSLFGKHLSAFHFQNSASFVIFGYIGKEVINHNNMTALEFSAKIENGLIRVPQQYGAYHDATVKVILLFDSTASEKKERLRSALLNMRNKKVFSRIENPVDWQKKLRDEWE